MSTCLNPFYWILSLLLLWPEIVFGSEGEQPVEAVKSSTDFGPLVDAAYVCGVCSVVVTRVRLWSGSLPTSRNSISTHCIGSGMFYCTYNINDLYLCCWTELGLVILMPW